MRDSITREFPTIADPFKHTLYKIIGRCELNKKTVPNVIIATEDYIWLQVFFLLLYSFRFQGKKKKN